MAAALAGSVAPDLDMIWFTFVNSSIHHHRFWPHIPAFCALIAAIVLAVTATLRPRWLPAFGAFFAGVFLHLLLDTPLGSIMWLWPLSDRPFTLITVPATQPHWVLSFLLHWTFLAEVVVIVIAAVLLYRSRR